MKFRLSEHPSIILFGLSLVILGGSIALCALFNWVIYAIFIIVLAGLAVIVLGYCMIKDILLYEKEKNKFLDEHKDGKVFEEDKDDWDRD